VPYAPRNQDIKMFLRILFAASQHQHCYLHCRCHNLGHKAVGQRC
jgi:hypothetical protein